MCIATSIDFDRLSDYFPFRTLLRARRDRRMRSAIIQNSHRSSNYRPTQPLQNSTPPLWLFDCFGQFYFVYLFFMKCNQPPTTFYFLSLQPITEDVNDARTSRACTYVPVSANGGTGTWPTPWGNTCTEKNCLLWQLKFLLILDSLEQFCYDSKKCLWQNHAVFALSDKLSF